MARKNPNTETTLHLKRTFAAPREKVFRVWTDPEELKKWWGPKGFSTPSGEVDLRVGGKYRLAMKPPVGEVFYLTGTYREVRPPEKLVYTWNWEGKACEGSEALAGETLVTVEFHDLGASTEVILIHELFPNEKARDAHDHGWNGCLDRLVMVL
jgi:uncharacterized protein YndB with AHSA1/START domain